MLFAKIKTDLLTAQKSGQSFVVSTLKLVLSELTYRQVDFKNAELPDEEVVKALFKEAKKRKDSIEIYTKINNEEMADKESRELEIIESYLPKLMSEDEVMIEIDKIAKETGLSSGRLMGAVMGKLKGKVDGGVVQKIVNENFS